MVIRPNGMQTASYSGTSDKPWPIGISWKAVDLKYWQKYPRYMKPKNVATGNDTETKDGAKPLWDFYIAMYFSRYYLIISGVELYIPWEQVLGCFLVSSTM